MHVNVCINTHREADAAALLSAKPKVGGEVLDLSMD